MGEKERSLLPVGEILRRQIRSLQWERKLREMRVCNDWARLVGPGIAEHATPLGVSNKRLAVAVENPAWAQQLAFLKGEILEKIRAALGPGVIEDIYLTGGREENRVHPDEEVAPFLSAPLDSEASRAIEESVSGIADQDVREALRKLLKTASCRKRRSR